MEDSEFCQEISSVSSSSCCLNVNNDNTAIENANGIGIGNGNGNDNAVTTETTDLTLKFRPLQDCDYQEIQRLHEELFPVRYTVQFYSNVILNQTTNGKPLYSSVAVIQHYDEESVMHVNHVDAPSSFPPNSMYRKLAKFVGIKSFEEEGTDQSWSISDQSIVDEFKKNGKKQSVKNACTDQIVGCIIGCFVDVSSVKDETSSLLIRDVHTHSKMFYIMTLGATEKIRNKGLGKKFVLDCIEMVEQVDRCGVIYLHVITYNAAAIRFYERLGFYRMDEIKDYYQIDGVKHSCYLYAYFLHGNRRSIVDILYSACNRVVTSLRSVIPFT